MSGSGFVRGGYVWLHSKGSTKSCTSSRTLLIRHCLNTNITHEHWYVRWMSLFSSHILVMAETIKESFSQMSEHFCCGLLRYLVLMAASVEKPISQRHHMEKGITNSTAQFDKTGIHVTYIVLQPLRTSLFMDHAVMMLI